MKTLPDSPNLDHLRQQAKDLLPQLREVRPGAALSDAQTLVAERYGFRTWPDLKAEVDRRCAATRTAGDATTAAVAAAFGLGTPQGPLVAVERQWAGQAWALTTDRGRWLARHLFDGFDESAVENEVLLASSAAAAGIQTPQPQRSPRGAVIETVEGGRWRVYERFPLGPEPPMPATPGHAAAAGRIVGTVHRMALPAPYPVSPWLTTVRTEPQLRHLQQAASERGLAWAGQLADLIPAIVDLGAMAETVGPDGPGPVVLSACDYQPGFFRVAGPEELVFLVWEHGGAITPRWDMGAAMAAWAGGVPGQVNEPAARAFLDGYRSVTEVPGPLDLGIFTANVCAHLSWLVSRIRIAACQPGTEAGALADRSLPWLLARLPERAWYQAVLDSVPAC